MDRSSSPREPEQLVLLDSLTALPLEGLQEPLRTSQNRTGECNRLMLNLGLLGPRLRAHAQRLGTSMSVLVRRATLKMLDEDLAPSAPAIGGQPFEHSTRNLHFHLNLPEACHAELTARARAADMTRGEFVWSLLKGISPAALPPDHATAVQALRVSTDRLAMVATDLNEFLRLLTRTAATNTELSPYQASIKSLNHSVAEHLKVASVLIAELKPYRRARW
jgi:hypothetical protein